VIGNCFAQWIGHRLHYCYYYERTDGRTHGHVEDITPLPDSLGGLMEA